MQWMLPSMIFFGGVCGGMNAVSEKCRNEQNIKDLSESMDEIATSSSSALRNIYSASRKIEQQNAAQLKKISNLKDLMKDSEESFQTSYRLLEFTIAMIVMIVSLVLSFKHFGVF